MAERALRIGVDGRELIGKPTGVGRYVLEVCRVWQTRRPAPELTIFVPADPPPDTRAALADARWRVIGGSAGTVWEQFRLPKALAAERLDVLFAPAYTAPLRSPCPVVVVVHDVSFFAHPEWFGVKEGFRRRRLTRAAARIARTVVTVSNFSKTEIVRHLRVSADRVIIASPGAPPMKGGSAGRQPVILYVGSLFNRRRVAEMIQALADAAPRIPGVRLVLAGDNRTLPRVDPRDLAARAGVGDRVEWREYVSDAERDELYDSASALAFLSDYEGFGLPPLEALAHGLPPVVLDTAISREIYGEAALRVSAEPSAIADGFVRIMTDVALRERILAAGSARLAAFSWQNSADILLAALQAAAR